MTKKNYKIILKKIENVRKKNNVNWMTILKIALEHNPKQTLNVMKKFITKIVKFQNFSKKSRFKLFI